MEQFRKNLWNSAAKAGLALGLVSSAYLFINQWTAEIGVPVLTGLMSFVLWAAKFGGCIWLMMFFMKKFVAENQDAVNSDTFRFGVVTALLSAFVYAAFSFANTAYFSADMIAENMDTVMQAYSQFMDSNTMAQMDKDAADHILQQSDLLLHFRHNPFTYPFAKHSEQGSVRKLQTG